MRKFILLLVTSLVTVSATAVNWVQMYKKDKVAYYVDIDSLYRSGNSVKVFLKFVSTDTTMISLSDVNCNSNPISYKILQATSYSGDESSPINTENSVRYANPGAVVELIFKATCMATK